MTPASRDSTLPPPDPATDWRRSHPDVVVHIPQGPPLNDTDNEHFLVYVLPGAEELLALWTQSSCEGRGDNHLVTSRSSDGEMWSAPVRIAGTSPGGSEKQASWGFLVIADTGRIYCFYTKEGDRYDNSRQGCGTMGCLVSDDSGQRWQEHADIPMPRNRFDHPDPAVPKNWIVWQKPVRDALGRWMAGYTQCTSNAVLPPVEGWWTSDSRAAFLRFENIHQGPDPSDLHIRWLPGDREGLEVPHRFYRQLSVAQEPSLVLLPDGRLFTTMRTQEGHIWYSVSADHGETWRPPEVLRLRDDGAPLRHPLSCCPIYPMGEGAYLLLYHDNDGTVGPYSQYCRRWKTNHLNFIRNPMWAAAGLFRPKAHQPIWFSLPELLLDTGGVPIGPKGSAEIATYTSMTTFRGRRTLWYPDRKYYLLGKFLTDAWFEGLAAGVPPS
ncbi:MAG: exo-alpha-sialidase [Lentisphaeria bacterium]|nr:exo-alpha-sialidase [Lentisphaeria bacterium]